MSTRGDSHRVRPKERTAIGCTDDSLPPVNAVVAFGWCYLDQVISVDTPETVSCFPGGEKVLLKGSKCVGAEGGAQLG